MKIYQDAIEINRFPRFIRRLDDQHFLRLHGINYNLRGRSDLYVEPVYLPFFQWQASGGQAILDVHPFWSEYAWTIILMQVFPYIWIGKSQSIRLEDYEDDDG